MLLLLTSASLALLALTVLLVHQVCRRIKVAALEEFSDAAARAVKLVESQFWRKAVVDGKDLDKAASAANRLVYETVLDLVSPRCEKVVRLTCSDFHTFVESLVARVGTPW